MSKITINSASTPTEEIVKKATAEVIVEDARGRKLVLKKPRFSAQWDLTQLLGPDLSANDAYRTQSVPLLYLVSLDGQVETFINVQEMKAILDRLDGDGWVALMNGIQEHFSTHGADVKEAAKKS